MKITREGRIVRAHPDGTRLRVLLLASDEPQHEYFRQLLGQRLDLVATVVETRAAQRRRLRCRSQYRDLCCRTYQGLRQCVTGRARHRRAYFGHLVQDLPTATSPVHQVAFINDPKVLRLASDLAPDLVVVSGTSALGSDWAHSAPGLAVRIHDGWLPEYPGDHGIHFAYRDCAWDRLGATLHLTAVGPGGPGPILEKVAVPLHGDEDDEHLYCRSLHLAVLRLTELALDLEQGIVVTVDPPQVPGPGSPPRPRGPGGELALWTRRWAGLHKAPGAPTAPRPAPAAGADLGYLLTWDDLARLRRGLRRR